MQALWTQEEASYEGEHVRFGRSWAWPKPVQQPRMPVLLGAGGSDRSFAWISRSADGWLTTPGEGDLEQKISRLTSAWREAGRSGAPQVAALAGKPDQDVIPAVLGPAPPGRRVRPGRARAVPPLPAPRPCSG